MLGAIHFGIPLIYYWYLKTRWLNKSWSIEIDYSYMPKASIIVPTYNEARFIEAKLDNIYEQDYPRDRLEIIVVDSASNDGTPEKVLEWSKSHPDVKVVLLRESVRRGKAFALNEVLKRISSEIVLLPMLTLGGSTEIL
ncbi:MAG: glycosyltransferase [Sulfolobales archaeon]